MSGHPCHAPGGWRQVHHRGRPCTLTRKTLSLHGRSRVQGAAEGGPRSGVAAQPLSGYWRGVLGGVAWGRCDSTELIPTWLRTTHPKTRRPHELGETVLGTAWSGHNLELYVAGRTREARAPRREGRSWRPRECLANGVGRTWICRSFQNSYLLSQGHRAVLCGQGHWHGHSATTLPHPC